MTAPDPVHWDNGLPAPGRQLTLGNAPGLHRLHLEPAAGRLRDGGLLALRRYARPPRPRAASGATGTTPCPAIPTANDGSASGNDDYGPGEGWDYTFWEWIVPAEHTGLVIEVRIYSNPGDTVWVDDIEVLAPDHAFIQFPGGPVGVEDRAWGEVKSLFR